MPEGNSGDTHEEAKLTPEEIQELENGIPSFLRRGFTSHYPTQPVENRDHLTEEQAHKAELRDPHLARQHKANLREDLGNRLDRDSGGISSSLDPINYNDIKKGEPTKSYVPDPAKISNN